MPETTAATSRLVPLRLGDRTLVEPSDTELLRRVHRGDVAAMDEVVNRHAPGLFALAMSMLRHRADAEDVVQETLLGAVRGLSSFEERSSLRTWLSRILIRQIARQHRSHRKAPEALDASEHRATDSASASPSMQVQGRLDVQTMLQTLSAEHREVLVLRELQGLSYEEIAQVLEVPRGTVESRLHRAREQLRQRFADY